MVTIGAVLCLLEQQGEQLWQRLAPRATAERARRLRTEAVDTLADELQASTRLATAGLAEKAVAAFPSPQPDSASGIRRAV